ESLARSQWPSLPSRSIQDRQTESSRAAARTKSHSAICRAAAVLGRHRPGSEGNLASDIENTPTTNATLDTPPQEQSAPEKTAERPAREASSETKTEDGAVVRPPHQERPHRTAKAKNPDGP